MKGETTGETTSDCKITNSGITMKNVALCSGYYAPILYRNRQMRLLTSKDSGILLTRYPL